MSRNVVIVMGRCSRSRQSFGMRFERHGPSLWVATWAFAIQESAGQREGYDQAQISGSFGFDPAFPGCPHCHSHGFFRCGCGKVACSPGETRTVTCPWCGATGELGGAVESLNAGTDR